MPVLLYGIGDADTLLYRQAIVDVLERHSQSIETDRCRNMLIEGIDKEQ